MKRSRSIRLALLGTAGLMSLTACEQADDPLKTGEFFANAQACEAAQNPQECKASYAQAQEEHVKTAPKFTSREQCEAEFGAANCVQTPGQAAPGQTAQAGGGSWFMPAMLGFMMGRMMGGGMGAMGAAPVYRDANNTAYTGRQPLGRIDPARMLPPQRVAGTAGAPSYGMARSGEASRGGFGRSGVGASS